MSWRHRYNAGLYTTGFYEPAEGEDGERDRGRAGGKTVEWHNLFGAITQRTNWTPKEILELTLGQLHAYIRYWTQSSKDEEYMGGGDGLLFDDIGTFNETAGIKRVEKHV